MIKRKSQLAQATLAAITFVLVLGALSVIWPGIMALFIGVFLLLYSCSAEQELLALTWTELGNVPFVFASLRRSGLQALFL